MNLLNQAVSLNSGLKLFYTFKHTQNLCICIQKYHLNLFFIPSLFNSTSVLLSLFKTPRQGFGTQTINLCLVSLIVQSTSLLLRKWNGKKLPTVKRNYNYRNAWTSPWGVFTLRNKQHFSDIQIRKVNAAHITEWLKSWFFPFPLPILPYISFCQ